MSNHKSLKNHTDCCEKGSENKEEKFDKNQANDARMSIMKLSKSVSELSKTLVLLAELVNSRSDKQRSLLTHIDTDFGTNQRHSTSRYSKLRYNKDQEKKTLAVSNKINTVNRSTKRVSCKNIYYKKITEKSYQTDFILH